jgi:hypothetical protein
MAINIRNLMTVVQTKLNATTSTTPALEFNRLSKLADTLNDFTTGIKTYTVAARPVADSANHGEIIYSTDSSAFYISEQLAWRALAVGDSAIVAAPGSTQAQGSTSGYVSGGAVPTAVNTIEKFSFTSDGNATDVGDLTQARWGGSGQSSTASGYTSGGYIPGTTNLNIIDKFPFSSDGNATDVGDLTLARQVSAGQSSTASGYVSGGQSPGTVNIIEKFPFSADANSSDVGDMTVARYATAGQSSTASGYTSGGATPTLTPQYTNIIEKFPFSSDTNASDVGDLTVGRSSSGGQSSDASGYVSGGYGEPGFQNVIDKFSFSSDANATDVGDITITRRYVTGQSSTASGYASGGSSPTGFHNTIEKFPFSSDANATDVGDLSGTRYLMAGQQV